jgi:hypothetical protein
MTGFRMHAPTARIRDLRSAADSAPRVRPTIVPGSFAVLVFGQ